MVCSDRIDDRKISLRGSSLAQKDCASLIARCTKLKTLVLSGIIIPTNVLLPSHLKKLVIEFPPNNHQLLDCLLYIAPKLRKLGLLCCAGCNMQRIVSFLHEAERAGVERLVFQSPVVEWRQQIKEIEFMWMYVEVKVY